MNEGEDISPGCAMFESLLEALKWRVVRREKDRVIIERMKPEWKEVPWWQALEWALGHPGEYIKIQEPGDTEPRLKIGCVEDKTIIRPIHLRTRHWVPVEEVA